MEIAKPITENQKLYANKLYCYLKTREVVTKEEMLDFLGWGKNKDRQLRDILSLIAKKKPLIATSDQKGYKLAKTLKDLEEVEHQWKEFDSRIQNLEERKKPLIAFYEKYKYGRENNENI